MGTPLSFSLFSSLFSLSSLFSFSSNLLSVPFSSPLVLYSFLYQFEGFVASNVHHQLQRTGFSSTWGYIHFFIELIIFAILQVIIISHPIFFLKNNNIVILQIIVYYGLQECILLISNSFSRFYLIE